MKKQSAIWIILFTFVSAALCLYISLGFQSEQTPIVVGCYLSAQLTICTGLILRKLGKMKINETPENTHEESFDKN